MLLRNLPLCTLLTCLMITGLRAEVIMVPATTSAGAWSSPLTAGVTYLVVSSGEYIFSGGPEYGDAEWLRLNTGAIVEFDPTPPGEWNAADRDICDLFINDQAVCWLGSSDGLSWSQHTYSPSHVYRHYLVGQGSAVKFHIADPTPLSHTEYPNTPEWYGDNSGELTVTITAVPEPASIFALLGGFAGLAGLAWRRRM